MLALQRASKHEDSLHLYMRLDKEDVWFCEKVWLGYMSQMLSGAGSQPLRLPTPECAKGS